ncbi:MAG: zinc-binding dehydrogenase [Candidatus Omnitrophica bacterium]|nr:zinc-binding dehydrogenase [Candidatus Omnitrophota bacterium]
MKAVFFQQHGGLDVLRYGDIPAPSPGEGEVLVKVEACGLNHLDLWMRQGLPGIKIPMPHISGSEVVGTVYAAPANGFQKGQRVLVAPGISCSTCSACSAGRESLCQKFRIVGLQTNGGYAEYMSVPARNLIPLGDKFKPEEWAAVPLVFLTAWHMLITRGQLKAGESVLIQGGGSGIGSAALQIAKLAGAGVFTTVGSEKKARKAKLLGADWVINHTKADVVKEVLKKTDQQGVDLVFEHVGPATWNGSIRCLKKGGRLVTCGATTGPKVELDLRFFFTKELTVMGAYMGSRYELDRVLALIEEGRLKPVVDTVFMLKEAPRAQKMMEERNFFGKIVLKI